MSDKGRGSITSRPTRRPVFDEKGRQVAKVFDVVVRYPTEGVNGATVWKTVRRRGFTSRDRARAALAKLVNQLDEGKLTPVHRGSPTAVDYFRKVIAEKLADRDEGIREVTATSYLGYLENHIAPRLGTRRIEQLTTRFLDSVVKSLKASGLKPSTVRQIHSIIEGGCSAAVREGIIAVNPATEVKLPRLRRRKREEINPDDVRRAIEGAPDPWRDIFAVMVSTGVRRSECLGLDWNHVDFEKRQIQIRQGLHRVRSVTRDRETGEETVETSLALFPTKSENSDRDLDLDEPQIALLRRIRARQAERLLSMGATATGETPVFDRDGVWRDPDSVSSAWAKAAKRAGLEGVRLHDLRALYATLLVDAGTPHDVVADLMGHHDASFTYAVYVRPRADAKREAAKRVSERLRIS